jgi:hypothetical protein
VPKSSSVSTGARPTNPTPRSTHFDFPLRAHVTGHTSAQMRCRPSSPAERRSRYLLWGAREARFRGIDIYLYFFSSTTPMSRCWLGAVWKCEQAKGVGPNNAHTDTTAEASKGGVRATALMS